MNKKLGFTFGIVGTLLLAVLLCFGLLRYMTIRLSLPELYAVLFIPTFSGVSASFYYYTRGSMDQKYTFESIPLKDEDEIFNTVNKDKPSSSEAPTPEVIPPQNAIVLINPNDPDALRKAMLAKVIQSINSAEVSVDVETGLTLEGEFEDPKITVGIHTPQKKKQETKDPPKEEAKTTESSEQLHRPRV
jgi:hypothetical protein